MSCLMSHLVMLRPILPTSGADPLVEDGYTVELLPKLAFFALWDGPPSAGLSGSGPRDSSVGRLPIGSPPPADTKPLLMSPVWPTS